VINVPFGLRFGSSISRLNDFFLLFKSFQRELSLFICCSHLRIDRSMNVRSCFFHCFFESVFFLMYTHKLLVGGDLKFTSTFPNASVRESLVTDLEGTRILLHHHAVSAVLSFIFAVGARRRIRRRVVPRGLVVLGAFFIRAGSRRCVLGGLGGWLRRVGGGGYSWCLAFLGCLLLVEAVGVRAGVLLFSSGCVGVWGGGG